MPLYEYECVVCGGRLELRMPVAQRDCWIGCQACEAGAHKRVFSPTTNIAVPEHFRHNQRDFLPAEGDTEAWEARGNGSQSHAPRQESLEQFLERDLRQ